jgi:hypothetical protein
LAELRSLLHVVKLEIVMSLCHYCLNRKARPPSSLGPIAVGLFGNLMGCRLTISGPAPFGKTSSVGLPEIIDVAAMILDPAFAKSNSATSKSTSKGMFNGWTSPDGIVSTASAA